MSHRTAVRDLRSLIISFHSLIAIETVEEERVRALLAEVAADLRLPFYEWSLTQGFTHAHGPRIAATEDPLAAVRHIDLASVNDAIYLLKDFAPHLATPNVARAFRELTQKLTSTRSSMVISGDPVDLPPEIEGLAVHYTLQMPDEEELRGIVRSVLDTIGTRQRVSVDLQPQDVHRLVRALAGLTSNQARQVIAEVILDDCRLAASDLPAIVNCKAQILARGGLLEFRSPDANHSELAGFAGLKSWLEQARVGFSPQARSMNLQPPKGLLLVGVQGCGKSLAAKFVARAWDLPLLKFDAGRLYDKFVGQSEKNLRQVFTLAEAMAPVVLWIDEIEKAFAQSSNSDADGGLSLRLFGTFLTWLQEKNDEVFVVGAANDLMRLPPEMLRKGRFDEIFFVDLPGASERKEIYAVHLRSRKQDPATFDLEALATATDGFSGAEIEQSVVSALYRSLQLQQSLVTTALLDAVRATVPLSVSRSEDVAALRAAASGRFRPVV